MLKIGYLATHAHLEEQVLEDLDTISRQPVLENVAHSASWSLAFGTDS